MVCNIEAYSIIFFVKDKILQIAEMWYIVEIEILLQ
jgi:hypothetical protein